MSALLTGLAQSAVMIAGGINAALIGSRYPAAQDTDGLFTAFAIYSLVVIVSSSSRIALVPRLIDNDQPFRPFNEMLVAIAWAIPVIGLLFVVIAPPAVASSLGGGAREILFDTLLILWPAAIGQFIAALGAAMLGVLNDFKSPAVAFTTGGALTIAVFVFAEPVIGLTALPVAVFAGTLLMIGLMFWALFRHGWRPKGLTASPVIAWRWQKSMTLGAAIYVCSQAMYLVSVSVAGASVGEGAATLYAYAYFAVGLAVAMVSASSSFVLAAPIANDWDGDPASLESVENDINRTGLLVLTLLAVVTALIGDDIAALVLTSFSKGDIELIVYAMLALFGTALGAQITVVPLIAMFTKRRLNVVAFSGIAIIAIHTLLTIAVGTAHDLTAIALAASASWLILAAAQIVLLHGSDSPARIKLMGADIALLAIAATVSFLPLYLTFDAAGLPAGPRDWATVAAGTGILFTLIWLALPRYRTIITRVLGSLAADGREMRN